MVEYCKQCGKVNIVSFCPRCENMFTVHRGRDEILCHKCKLTVKLCMCKMKLPVSGAVKTH